MSITSGHPEGPVALGGNYAFDLYTSVANNYTATPYYPGGAFYGQGDSRPTVLVVGGTLNLAGSSGDHQVLQQGFVKIGNLSGITVHPAGTNTHINGDPGNQNTQPRLSLTTAQSYASVAQSTGIDFNARFATMQGYAAQMAALVDSSQVEVRSGSELGLDTPNGVNMQVGVNMSANKINVYNITPTQLNNIQYINWNSKPSDTQPVIFNVSGTGNFTWTGGGFNSLLDDYARYMLFNFYQTTGTITIEGYNTIVGALYAPSATIVKNGVNSNVSGQLVAATYIHNGGEMHPRAFLINMLVSDTGDLPDSYWTTTAAGGPCHVIVPTLKLGANEDNETDGQPNLTATGDDNNPPAGPDDEDGVTLVLPLIAGQQACVAVTATNTTGVNAYLYGWIDFNGDGNFGAAGSPDAGELLSTGAFAGGRATLAGSVTNQQYCFTVPATALGRLGSAYMRFRLTSDDLAATQASAPWGGSASNGEVEDYVTPLGAIGNYVWVDENSDGYQDAGERGIPNVTVNLYDTAGAIIATTVTDSHGGYLFPNLPAGSYFVRVDATTLPAGMTQTTVYTNQGADFGNQDQTTGTNDYGYPVTIGGSAPLENLTADFGYNFNPTTDVDNPPSGATAALGDRLWIDVDGDGKQDPDEVGVRGATVQLFTAGPDGIFGTGDDVPGATQTTDANGYYLFDGLAPGAYVVKVTSSTGASHPIPTFSQGQTANGYTQTGDPDHFGATDTSAGANDGQTTAPVVLGPGDVFLNADFGYRPDQGTAVGTIGDTVWFDANASGTATIDTGEYGIPGVTVALIRDTDGDGVWDAGEPIIATDTTDANGNYLFTGLSLSDDGDGNPADADYIVWVNDTDAVLTGLAQTYDQDSPLDNRSATALSAGTPSDLEQDFSYTAAGQTPTTGLIGDTVWFDLIDPSGATQQTDEPGIEGVLMELLDSGGNVIATTTTDENGHYYFGGLPVSSGGIQYRVRVAASNFAAGGVLQGLDETYAAGGAVGGNQGNLVSLTTAAPINLAQDFSYRATSNPGRIGNLVWLDANADGDFDGVSGPGADPNAGTDDDEPALGDVTVDLYRDLNCNGRVDAGDPRISTQKTASAINAGSYGADGVYSFNRLATVGACGGNAAGYVVNVTDAAGVLYGYWHSLGTAGTDNNSQVDPYAAQISAAAVENLTADFGYYVEPASLGNRVWLDLNGNGIQDAGEPGIDGVTVQLVITWPNNDTTTLKVVSGDNLFQSGTQIGWYGFGNLLLDEDYRIGSTTATPGTNQPAHVISVDTTQTALAQFMPTTIGAPGSTIRDDSNNPVSPNTVGVPVQGLTDVQQLANPNNEQAIASYDFGFKAMDLGDLPNSFTATLKANNGARHGMVSTLRLGACVDAETNGQPSATAVDDDSGASNTTLNGGAYPVTQGTCGTTNDDEDGVTLATPLVAGGQACVSVTAVNTTGGAANLWGWIDFDGDGVFTASEALTGGSGGTGGNFSGGVATVVNGYTGPQTFCFQVPATATYSGGDTHMRFRLTTDTLNTSAWVGLASNGEVEDYYQQLACVGNLVWDDSSNNNGRQDTGEPGLNGATVYLVWAGPNTVIDTPEGSTTASPDDVIYSDVTAGNGLYEFCGVLPGTYQIKVVTPPSGFPYASVPNAGIATDFTDSDGVQSGGSGTPSVIPAFTISSITTLPTGENGLFDGSPINSFPDNQENRSYDFGFKSTTLAVLLAGFDASAQTDHVLVTWETVSEANNAGFNLYRATSADGERTLLGFTPSAAPGSTQGAAYSYADSDVVAGQGYWYWLEDIDLAGAATLHGPVSAVFQAPTAVTLNGLSAGSAAGSASLWLAAAGALAGLAAAAYGLRRRLAV